MTDPTHVLVAGDWHGNTDWAVGVIERLPELLPDESPRVVLHAGDFGIWPGRDGQDYVDDVAHALLEADALLWFVDGNHEDYDQLTQALASASGRRDVPIGAWESWGVPQRIAWLPRGYRWTWHDRTWLALGGAVSVDHRARVRGRSWWPQEQIGVGDGVAALGGGPVDVLLAHDCPSAVNLNLPRPAPRWWDIETAEKHREHLQGIVDQLEPAHIIHGHYHLSHDTRAAMLYGRAQVTGLDADGSVDNYRVLNVQTMTWEPA